MHFSKRSNLSKFYDNSSTASYMNKEFSGGVREPAMQLSINTKLAMGNRPTSKENSMYKTPTTNATAYTSDNTKRSYVPSDKLIGGRTMQRQNSRSFMKATRSSANKTSIR